MPILHHGMKLVTHGTDVNSQYVSLGEHSQRADAQTPYADGSRVRRVQDERRIFNRILENAEVCIKTLQFVHDHTRSGGWIRLASATGPNIAD